MDASLPFWITDIFRMYFQKKKTFQSYTLKSFTKIKKLLTRIELVTSTLPMLRTTDCAIAACSSNIPTSITEDYIIIERTHCQ